MPLFETFLIELARALQFEKLVPDESGACLIVMHDGKIPLLFELDKKLVPNTVLLSSPASPIPVDRKSDIYEALLKENHTSENIFSIKSDEDLVYLHCRLHPKVQANEIENILNNFMESLKDWKVKVEKIIREPPSSLKIPPPPSSIKVFPYKA